MRIASRLAGFTMSQADSLRRAMSKKTPEIMGQARVSFVEGAVKNGVEEQVADKVFNLIEYFAGYGFNKSHSTAYALISYRTAYLKANYPVEFMTALLTSEKDDTDKIVTYIGEASRMGIKILPPDVNESFAEFTVGPGNSIRFGLVAVKNIGEAAIESIVKAREKYGKFSSLYEFCEGLDLRLVNRKVIESLIKCGAFDSLKVYRSQLMATLNQALEVASGIQKDRLRGQMSFFDSLDGTQGFKKKFRQIPKIKEWHENELLAFEKEVLGFYITGHPLAKYERLLKTFASVSTGSLSTLQDGEMVSMGGIVIRVKHLVTRKTGERMAIAALEDLDGIVEVLVFPGSFETCARFLRKDSRVFIRGKLNLKEEKPKVFVEELIPLEKAPQKYTRAMIIRLFTPGLEEETLLALKEFLASHPGNVPTYLEFTLSEGQKVRVLAGKELYVEPSEEFSTQVEALLGEGVVSFQV